MNSQAKTIGNVATFWVASFDYLNQSIDIATENIQLLGLYDKAPIPKRLKNAPLHEPTKFEGTGRNKPCPCGSGVKFKRCCEKKPQG